MSTASATLSLPETEPLPELAELIARCRQGSEPAFEELYRRTRPQLTAAVQRIVVSPDLMREVTQEAYLQIWREAGRFDPARGQALSWMVTIARRRAVDRVRTVSGATLRDRAYAVRHAPDDVPDVWEDVSQRLDAVRVRRAVQRLGGVHREAVTLRYLAGLSQNEVAGRLGIPLGTAKTRIRDGMRRLRSLLVDTDRISRQAPQAG